MSEEGKDITYKEKLSKARSIPQEHNSVPPEKQSAAKDLQIETYLSYARLISLTKARLNIQPDIEYTDLVKEFENQKTEFSRPEVVDKFLKAMSNEIALTNIALLNFRKAAGLSSKQKDADVLEWEDNEKESMGRFIFKSITGKDPVGMVKVTDTTFAVGLVTQDDDDFKTIQSSDKNIGGFYRHRESVKIDGKSQKFPLIVIKTGPGSGGIMRHEVGHSVNQAIIDILETISSQEFKNRWGGAEDQFISTRDENGNPLIIERPGQLSVFLEEKVAPKLFSLAKNELLADFQRHSNFEYVDSVTKRHGVYDTTDIYLDVLKTANALKITQPEVGMVVDKFWADYTEQVKASVREVEALNDLYLTANLDSRRDLLPYVLAQIPIQAWKDTPNRSYLGAFSQEIGLYLSLEFQIIRLEQNNQRSEKIGELKRKFDQIRNWGSKNPTKSLFPKLNEFLQELNSVT
jgi:hypothetical protein